MPPFGGAEAMAVGFAALSASDLNSYGQVWPKDCSQHRVSRI